MRVDVKNKEDLRKYFTNLQNWLAQKPVVFTKYLDFGVKVIRIISYDKDFLPHIKRQLTYVLRDEAASYDETLVVFKEEDFKNVSVNLSDEFNPKKNMRLRLDLIINKLNYPNLQIMDKDYSAVKPVINIGKDTIEAYDQQNKIFYYAVKDLEPEEFIKRGHAFVHPLNNLIKTPTTNIVHGAIIGYNNNGMLFCARGHRGKSTLTVHAMMHDFEYVSDDYQILENKDGQLLSYPIYSIITLSPMMYSELYDDLKGKFVSNNARKDKYVINIAGYHNQFRKAYPIRFCLFPEIVSDKEPSITFCTPQEKGRAIVHLIQSTTNQAHDLNNRAVIEKLYTMVKDLDFYKFNLCRDLDANTEYLRDFLKKFNFDFRKGIKTNRILVDITYDLANIIDSETCTIYSMNKFATNVYENLLLGKAEDEIWQKIAPFASQNANLHEEFTNLVSAIHQKGFIQSGVDMPADCSIKSEFAEECKFKLSLREFATDGTIELTTIK